MRRDNLSKGNYYHVVVRGAGGVSFLKRVEDFWLCIKLLFYQNDTLKKRHWERQLKIFNCKFLQRPEHWPPQDPRIKILAFCIHDNHIHLLVKEIKDGGLTAFMRRFPNSLSNKLKKRYGNLKRMGNAFQAAYKLRLIESDADLRNVALYIMSKNVFERYPNGGIDGALENWDDALKWALEDSFSSFPDFAGKRNSPILDKDVLRAHFPTTNKFIKEARAYLENWEYKQDELGKLAVE